MGKPEQDVVTGEALGNKLLQSVLEMKADTVAHQTLVTVNEVIEARHKTGFSQMQFAEALCISKRTLQECEQGRRAPLGAAKVLIRNAKQHPEILLESLTLA